MSILYQGLRFLNNHVALNNNVYIQKYIVKKNNESVLNDDIEQ